MLVYTISSTATGAYTNDCDVGSGLIPEIFGDSLSKAFPNHGDQYFTAIAHNMMLNGNILNEMLTAIEAKHDNTPAWVVLSKLQHNLSEWELYMAWIMKHHRGTFVLRQTPFINWGLVESENLEWLRENTDIAYLTNHDEMTAVQHCCVNSKWRTTEGASYDVAKYREPNFSCLCCQDPNRECDSFTIDCHVLRIEGCRLKDGLLWIDEVGNNTSTAPVQGRLRTNLSPSE